MNQLEKRLETLEQAKVTCSLAIAIVPAGFRATLPKGNVGICTGVPRFGDKADELYFLKPFQK